MLGGVSRIEFVGPAIRSVADSWRALRSFNALRSLIGVIMVAPLVSGCFWASMGEPDRVYSVADETAGYKNYFDDPQTVWRDYNAARDKTLFRNDFISARMYLIDMQYTNYESQLTHEGQGIDFGTKIASGVLTTTSGLIPVLYTSHALADAATFVNGVDTAYNDKILRTQIIQNVEASMRIARHDQAAVILANMKCDVSVYPIGLALSDLETYYRAGTFQTGMMKLLQTVAKAEKDASATQDASNPAPSVAAQATLAANAAEANFKADANVKKDVPSKGCTDVTQGKLLGARHPHH
jgi:hypothetical protein